jgi:hypothetical protein
MTSESQNPPSNLKKIDSIAELKNFFLKKKKKSSKDNSNFDYLFRHFITSETPEDQLDTILDLFLNKLDFNFQNQNNENVTPLMYLVGEGLNSLCEQVIHKIGEKLELSKKDDKQENIFFKIINSSNDNGKVNLFKTALSSIKEISEEEEKKEALDSINSSGKSLIECALNVGNSDISSMLLMEGIQPNIKNSITGDNLLHFAIRGKNPFCLKMVLNTVDQELIYELIKETNKDNETPLQLAKKLNIVTMVKQINDFISGEKKSKISGENNEDEIYGMLAQLDEENTEKIVNSIKKNYYVSDWNKLFLEIIEKNKSNQKFDVDLDQKICEYFGFDDDLKENSDDKENKEENEIKFPISLNQKENEKDKKYDFKNNMHFLNYIVGAEHNGNFQNLLNALKRFIQNYKSDDQNIDNYITYVNTVIILIEKCLSQNLVEFASILIENLSKFLQDNNIDPTSFDFKNSNSSQFLKYLSVNEVANPTIDLKGLIYLYQCDLNLLKGNFEKAKENLVEFKSKFYGGEEKRNKSNEPIHKTMENLYNFLKIKVDYFLNIQFKLNKHLSVIDKNKSNNDSILFYYNFLGIINMKQGHYAYAEYCFKFCRDIISQNSMQYLKYLSAVEYNLALCYFFTEKYDKSIEILKNLKDLDSMKNNPYLFYRLALCYIEQEFQKNEKNFKKNNENDIVNKTIFDETSEEASFRKRFILVNQSLSPSITNTDENKENQDETESISRLNFVEAIRYLKECILIIKGYNSFNEQIYTTLKPLMNNEVINLKGLFIDEAEEKEKNYAEQNNIQYKDIYDSAFLNLIFCLIRNESYAEAIEFIEEFRENNSSSNKYKFILDNYAIEAYLKLGEYEKALNILSKDNFSCENPEEKGAFFSNSNNQVYDEITFRLALYINLIKINILNSNFKEAEKYVISVLSLLNYPTEKELPPYVINIIVFYFLSIGKNEEAVQIIKFRRIPKFYNN